MDGSNNMSRRDAYRLGRQQARRQGDMLQWLQSRPEPPLGAWLAGYRRGRRYQRARRIAARMAGAVSAIARTAGPGLKYAALALVAVPLLAAAGLAAFWGLNVGRIEALVARAERNMACARSVALRAADGTIVASTPAPGCAPRPFQSLPLPADLTLEIAESFGAIEGRWREAETWAGHDLTGIPRKIYGVVTGQERGFSGPLLTTFEYAADMPLGLSLRDKLLTFRAASIFVRRNLPSDAARAAFIVENTGAVIGRGAPMAGALAAQAMFGRLPETLLERCMLARAMGVQLYLPKGDDAAAITPRMADNWARVVGAGTARCIRLRAESQAREARSLAALRELCNDSDACIYRKRVPDDSLRAGLYMAAARAHMPVAAEPGRISRAGQRIALDALRLSNGAAPPGAHATTIDRAAQQALDRALPGALEEVARRLAPGTCLARRDCSNPVQYAAVVVELNGEEALVRASAASNTGTFFGPVGRRSGSNGFMALAPDWGMGSTGKMLLALVAARHNVARLCTDPAGGGQCHGGAWLPTQQAIARSHNGAAAWLAGQYLNELSLLQDAMGFWPGTMAAQDYALGTGRLAPPSAYVTLLAALFSDSGRSDGVRVGAIPPHGGLDLAKLGHDQATRQRARAILAGPVGPGGTLEGLVRAARIEGCQALAGKSGTHSAGNVTIVKTSTILWQCQAGRRFVTQVRLSTEAADRSLGERVPHAALAPLYRALLKALGP